MTWVCPICSTNNEESDSRCVVCKYERDVGKIFTLTYNRVQSLDLSGDVVVPEKFNAIGDGAFKDRNDIYSVTLHNKMRKIGKEAFCGCSNLERVICEAEIESVGKRAFAECTSLPTTDRVKAKRIAADAYDVILQQTKQQSLKNSADALTESAEHIDNKNEIIKVDVETESTKASCDKVDAVETETETIDEIVEDVKIEESIEEPIEAEKNEVNTEKKYPSFNETFEMLCKARADKAEAETVEKRTETKSMDDKPIEASTDDNEENAKDDGIFWWIVVWIGLPFYLSGIAFYWQGVGNIICGTIIGAALEFVLIFVVDESEKKNKSIGLTLWVSSLISYILWLFWGQLLMWINVGLSGLCIIGELISLGNAIYKKKSKYWIYICIAQILISGFLLWRIFVT